jgi:hypothetical protein
MKTRMGAGKGAGLKVATALKAGRIAANHNRTVLVGLKVKTAFKAGRLSANHNRVLR